MKAACVFVVVAYFFSVVFGVPFAYAGEKKGKLDSFEDAVLGKDSSTKSSTGENRRIRHGHDNDGDDDGEHHHSDSEDTSTTVLGSFLDIFLNIFLMGLGTNDMNMMDKHKDLKAEWSPALPTIKIEPSYQYIKGNLHGVAGRIEAGYMLFGLDGRYDRFFEKAPNDSLDVWSAHFLLRSLLFRSFGMNLAMGVKTIKGGQSHTGFEAGLPFYIFLGKHFIIDGEPYMTTIKAMNIWDLGAGLSYKYKFFGVRAGYRAMIVRDERLHGPIASLFFQW